MGRVVPLNVGTNLLTRLLDLERAGGYQVDQQARMNLRLVPQHGGTVAGVRRSALREIGGWNDNSLTEDTDLTYRLLLAGWKTVYQNRSECYEEVPETWSVRIKQIMRWAKGHNQALATYGFRLLFWKASGNLARTSGWLLALGRVRDGAYHNGWLAACAGCLLPGSKPPPWRDCGALHHCIRRGRNFAAFFEIAAAARLDSTRERIRLLPLLVLGFLVSIVAVSRAVISQMLAPITGAQFHWDKTERFRAPS